MNLLNKFKMYQTWCNLKKVSEINQNFCSSVQNLDKAVSAFNGILDTVLLTRVDSVDVEKLENSFEKMKELSLILMAEKTPKEFYILNTKFLVLSNEHIGIKSPYTSITIYGLDTLEIFLDKYLFPETLDTVPDIFIYNY